MNTYYQYEFAVEELPENWTIRAGKAAPWAGQPGGATQLQVFGLFAFEGVGVFGGVRRVVAG